MKKLGCALAISVLSMSFAQVGPSGPPATEFEVGEATVALAVLASPYSFDDCMMIMQDVWDDEWDLDNGSGWILSANTPWGWDTACFALPPGVAWNQAIQQLPEFDLFNDWDVGAQFTWVPGGTGIMARSLVIKDRVRHYVLIGASPAKPVAAEALEPYLEEVWEIALHWVVEHGVEELATDCSVDYQAGSRRTSNFPMAEMQSCEVIANIPEDTPGAVELWVEVLTTEGLRYRYP